MKEIPLLYSPPMVQATVDNIKTLTRRMRGLDKINENPDDWEFDECFTHSGKYEREHYCYQWRQKSTGLYMPLRGVYGRPGDVLWVRETHYHWGGWCRDGLTKKTKKDKWRFVPERPPGNGLPEVLFMDNPPAVIEPSGSHSLGWHKRPSLFLPYDFARIWLRVEDVRAERLQDISEEDALAEGIRAFTKDRSLYKYWVSEPGDPGAPEWADLPRTAKQAFMALWVQINGFDSYAANPWVWVVSFKALSTTGKPAMQEAATTLA